MTSRLGAAPGGRRRHRALRRALAEADGPILPRRERSGLLASNRVGTHAPFGGSVVVAELGWTAMATVDTLMVGRLSAEAIGAVGLGSAVFLGVSMFGLGLLLGLDTMISQAFGAGDSSECYRSLVHGVYAALGLTLPLSGVIFVVVAFLPGFGINPDVLVLTIPYLKPVAGSLLPLLLYSATRRFLQATGHANAVMIVLVTANLVNALTNWVLVFGHWGFPALGVVGAGWATLMSRSYMALALVGCIIYYDRRGRDSSSKRLCGSTGRVCAGCSTSACHRRFTSLSRWAFSPWRRLSRTIGRGFSRGASDRAVGRGHDLHGAARRVVCGRRSGRACVRPRR